MKKTKLKKIFAITFSAVSITAVIIANIHPEHTLPQKKQSIHSEQLGPSERK